MLDAHNITISESQGTTVNFPLTTFSSTLFVPMLLRATCGMQPRNPTKWLILPSIPSEIEKHGAWLTLCKAQTALTSVWYLVAEAVRSHNVDYSIMEPVSPQRQCRTGCAEELARTEARHLVHRCPGRAAGATRGLVLVARTGSFSLKLNITPL